MTEDLSVRWADTLFFDKLALAILSHEIDHKHVIDDVKFAFNDKVTV